ncbi:MAG: dienelactone hydrolase family protein [Gemmatimonadetes bacterium]|nr:dienelactone hydrolase family protein [Gemmatimonadota bacterium]
MIRHRTLHRSLTIAPLLGLLALITTACGGPGADAESADADMASEAETVDVAAIVEQLPPAIVGNGGELAGSAVSYVPGDDATVGYLSVPEGEGPFPALIIVHEWNGLVDRVRQVADDLADEGYVVLAADLYAGRTGANPEENMALVQEVNADPETMVANLDAAVALLRARDDVTGRVGTMGWCFGGGVVLSFGLDGVNHEATAIFYGRLLDDPDALEAMDHEVYGTFASEDSGPSPEQVEAFETALDAAGVAHDLHIYDDVNHGFWLRVDQNAELRAEPALDAWERLKAYLDRTLRN